MIVYAIALGLSLGLNVHILLVLAYYRGRKQARA